MPILNRKENNDILSQNPRVNVGIDFPTAIVPDGDGFFKGAGEWIKSTILSFLLIPAFPCLYLLPSGWRLGEVFQFELLGCLGVTAFVVLSAMCALTFAWVAALKVLNNFVHAFFAGIMGMFVFTFPPMIAFAVGQGA